MGSPEAVQQPHLHKCLLARSIALRDQLFYKIQVLGEEREVYNRIQNSHSSEGAMLVAFSAAKQRPSWNVLALPLSPLPRHTLRKSSPEVICKHRQ